MISPSQRPVPDNTQQSQETDTYVAGGTRTRKTYKRAAANPCLMACDLCDRHIYIYIYIYIYMCVCVCVCIYIYIYAYRQYSILKGSVVSHTNSSICSIKTERMFLTRVQHYLCNLQRNFWKKYINNQKIHFNIYCLFYSQCSHQHVSVGITAIFRIMLLLQRHKRTNVVSCFTITLKMAEIPAETC